MGIWKWKLGTWVFKAFVCSMKGHIFKDIGLKDSSFCYSYRLCLRCGKIEDQQNEIVVVTKVQKYKTEVLPHQKTNSHLRSTEQAKIEAGRSFQKWSM